jgi:hypothetical protein
MPEPMSRILRRPQLRALAALLLMATLARLPMMLGSHGADFDMESYGRLARLMSAGGRLYGDPDLAGRYPYLPAWAMIVWGLHACAMALGGVPAWLYKVPAFLADLGITVLIYIMASRMVAVASPAAREAEPVWASRAFWASATWALSPTAFLISAGHGQFDSLALCLVLLGAWYIEFSEHPHSDFAGALSLGFAIALKTWPLFFLPLFIRGMPGRREQLRFAALSLAFPLCLLLPFAWLCGWAETLHALSYAGSQALSLPESLRGLFFASGASPESYKSAAWALGSFNLAVLALLWSVYVLGPWSFPLFPGLAFATLTLYVFAPGLAAQYLCWLLPFALLIPGRLALRHGMVSLAALLLFYGFFAPEAFLREGQWVAFPKPSWFFALWALLNLALWLFFVREWMALGRLCLRPSGRTALA